MNTFSLDCGLDGMLVELRVGFSLPAVGTLRRAGQVVPQPITVTALLDTGSDVSCIEPTSIATLVNAGLVTKRYIFVNVPHAGGLAPVREFDVSLAIIHPDHVSSRDFTLRNHPVFERALGAMRFDALIGRDVLSKCVLVCDGPSGRFTLGY